MNVLQDYLALPLPEFKRGSADCCSFVVGWAAYVAGAEKWAMPTITQGEARRKLARRPLIERAPEFFGNFGFVKASVAEEGSILVFPCSEAFGGFALGIYSNGQAVTRMEGAKIHLHKDVAPVLILSRAVTEAG